MEFIFQHKYKQVYYYTGIFEKKNEKFDFDVRKPDFVKH